MSLYNLSDNVNDSFQFVLDGKKFEFRYPITEELERFQDLNSQLKTAESEKDEAKVKEVNDQMTDMVYEYISPVEHDESIREMMKKQNIKVMKNFNTMIRTELSV